MAEPERALIASHLRAAILDGEIQCHPVPGPPPIPGAQWDEIRGCWERWIDDHWVFVEEHIGGPTLGPPLDDVVLPATLARDLLVAHELDIRHADAVIDLTVPEPVVRLPGAQWNEVVGRWERWDWEANDWVAATST